MHNTHSSFVWIWSVKRMYHGATLKFPLGMPNGSLKKYPLGGDNRLHPLRHYWLRICISLVESKAYTSECRCTELNTSLSHMCSHVSWRLHVVVFCSTGVGEGRGWQLCGEVRPPDGGLWNQTRWLSGDSDQPTHTNTLACARISLLLLCCHLVCLLPSLFTLLHITMQMTNKLSIHMGLFFYAYFASLYSHKPVNPV